MARKAKGRSVANGEQTLIKEIAPKKIPDIHIAAKRYAKVRDQRSALSVEEKAARDHLKNIMEEHELVNYEYGDLVVCIDTTCKAVVKAKDSEADAGSNGEASEE